MLLFFEFVCAMHKPYPVPARRERSFYTFLETVGLRPLLKRTQIPGWLLVFIVALFPPPGGSGGDRLLCGFIVKAGGGHRCHLAQALSFLSGELGPEWGRRPPQTMKHREAAPHRSPLPCSKPENHISVTQTLTHSLTLRDRCIWLLVSVLHWARFLGTRELARWTQSLSAPRRA